jgi:hypothetical protein
MTRPLVRLVASGICHSDTAATPPARCRHEARIQPTFSSFIFCTRIYRGLARIIAAGSTPACRYCDAIFKVLESPALSQYFFGDATPA